MPLALAGVDDGARLWEQCGQCGGGSSVPPPDDWQQLRGVAMDRPWHRCEATKARGRCLERAVDVHHRIPRFRHAETDGLGMDIHDVNNLVALCRRCHEIETFAERAREPFSSSEIDWMAAPL